MKIAGLFAGIGGLEAGLASAGHHASMLCEIWDPARRVLEQRFGNAEIVRDVAHVRSLPAGTELIAAGFPCQDLSQAGLTAGIDGTRSSLVSHVFRLIDGENVPWVLLENVSFMLHLDQGKAVSTILSAFEERGYRWAYRVVNSLGFLPQRRERIIIVATKTSEDPSNILHVDDAQPPLQQTGLATHAHGFYWTEGIRGLGWAPDAVPTLKNGSTVGIPSPPAILLPTGEVITPDIRDAERLQGFESDWTSPASDAGRESLRWSLVGNAVTVPVAEWIGRRLAAPGAYDGARDMAMPRSGRWPKAARLNDDGKRVGVQIGSCPEWRNRPEIHRFLRYRGKPLSKRATAGFLSRTERSSLTFVPGFLDAVRSHLACQTLNDNAVSSRQRVAVNG
jgi:DNA (cytosine-5)-methyltransferase 1